MAAKHIDMPYEAAAAANPLMVARGSDYMPFGEDSSRDRYRNHNDLQTKKSEACCTCVTVSALLFLLIFFLSPRKPDLVMDKVVFDTNGNGTITAVTGKFKFSNNDYFSVKWSDLDANLYWTVNLDQAVLPECQQSVNECDTMFFGECAVKLGKFKDDSKFKTGSRKEEHQQMALSMSGADKACAQSMLLGSDTVSQSLLTKGSAKAEGALRDFGRVNTKKTVYYYA